MMKALAEQIADLDAVEIYGRVAAVRGLMVEVAGPIHAMSVGARLTLETGVTRIPCEVVGFAHGHALAMPFAALDGVRRGCPRWSPRPPRVSVRRMARPCGECVWRADRRPGPLPPGLLFIPSAHRRRLRMCAAAWATRSILVCARSIHSSHRSGRRARPRGAGVLAGRLGSSRSRPLGRCRLDVEPALMRRQAAYLTLAIAE
jgi:flagellum-specific ATP synthase